MKMRVKKTGQTLEVFPQARSGAVVFVNALQTAEQYSWEELEFALAQPAVQAAAAVGIPLKVPVALSGTVQRNNIRKKTIMLF